MHSVQSRRRFLTSLSLASAAALVGAPRSLHAEPPPETTTVRLPKYIGDICHAPAMVAEELLRAEGFTEVRYIEPKNGPDATALIARGEMDFDYDYVPAQIALIEAGVPVVMLAGIHSGCLELIANDNVRSIVDLRGKRVGVDDYTTYPHLLLRLMVAYVGLDPERDIQWVTSKDLSSIELFATGQTDAFVGPMPEPRALRARKIGHSIFNSGVDRPWSEYLCCTLVGNAAFVRDHPVATKRVLRAILKATDLCASQPKLVAQQLVDSGIATRFDDALQMLIEVRFDRSRDFDPEDTVRFFALRMYEAGMIKSSPQKILANGTDFRFLNELKRELKG